MTFLALVESGRAKAAEVSGFLVQERFCWRCSRPGMACMDLWVRPQTVAVLIDPMGVNDGTRALSSSVYPDCNALIGCPCDVLYLLLELLEILESIQNGSWK